MKYAIGTIYYNSFCELKRLLESIPSDVIDYFIGVDGIFKYIKEKNPGYTELSNDSSKELIFEYSDHLNFTPVIINAPNSIEFDKRMSYLKTCKDLDVDVLIIVDSDEYFVYDTAKNDLDPYTHWQIFKNNIELHVRKKPHHNVYGIKYIEGDNADTYKPRIWYKPGDMTYVNGSHYHYANKITEQRDIDYFKSFGSAYCQHADAVIKGGLSLTQNNKLRSETYMDIRKDYQQYLVRFEELIQSGKYSEKEAHEIAKQRPATDFKPTDY